MRRKPSLVVLSLQAFILLFFVWGLSLFFKKEEVKSVPSVTVYEPKTTQKTTSATSSKSSVEKLPEVSTDDWELLLVNQDNTLENYVPDLASINGFYIDSRISEAVTKFLAKAQEIDSNEHLIWGYISYDYQTELYQYYITQEMQQDSTLTWEAAEAKVQKYAKPAGQDEHQTGLAITMSNVDALNESSTSIVQKLATIAPDYGFVLRYPEGKETVTGMGYLDWHFRYVGKKSAKYMTENDLTLEEYIDLLKESE